jgi:hypothetical protein
MKVNGGSFGGRFVPVGGHRGELSVLSGTVSGQQVTGSVKDASYSSREHRLCHGSARFSVGHS